MLGALQRTTRKFVQVTFHVLTGLDVQEGLNLPLFAQTYRFNVALRVAGSASLNIQSYQQMDSRVQMPSLLPFAKSGFQRCKHGRRAPWNMLLDIGDILGSQPGQVVLEVPFSAAPAWRACTLEHALGSFCHSLHARRWPWELSCTYIIVPYPLGDMVLFLHQQRHILWSSVLVEWPLQDRIVFVGVALFRLVPFGPFPSAFCVLKVASSACDYPNSALGEDKVASRTNARMIHFLSPRWQRQGVPPSYYHLSLQRAIASLNTSHTRKFRQFGVLASGDEELQWMARTSKRQDGNTWHQNYQAAACVPKPQLNPD
ncbi:uncharacterized protein G2W53_026730 [Senna tora]|uniref:Uncharacterized protein n=1 Tax=Senna tora TaxID=362788 RepID=A0A834THZ2_9FABA|nr:uncharacterized protein G2W53_026730 [Senna tora]